MATTDFTDWIEEFAARYPVVADDLLEAIDDYLLTDFRDGEVALADSEARKDRIERLTRLRVRLIAKREARGS